MGKSVTSPANLQQFARIISSNRLNRRPNGQIKPPSAANPRPGPESEQPVKLSSAFLESNDHHRRFPPSKMEGNSISNSSAAAVAGEQEVRRSPLAEVVADCVRRWFKDTLKEAKGGDSNMQVLVGQMYFSGYGVPRDAQKGKAWMTKASSSRASAWKVSEKHPGYNVSDSDSEDKQMENK